MLYCVDNGTENTQKQSWRCNMFIEERHNEILEKLRQNGKVTIAEITQKYGISDESARRDLRLLEKQGM